MKPERPETDASAQADAVIVGGGPGGLVAAIYLSRYRRRIRVFDAGDSRAELIPRIRNVPGFAGGISGPALLHRLRRQAEAAGVVVERARVTELQPRRDGFAAMVHGDAILTKTVVLATGCKDVAAIPGLTDSATWRGHIRWCPICDGYEALDRKVVVLGDAAHGAQHALFLRTYTRDLTLVLQSDRCSAEDERKLEAAGIRLVNEAALRATATGKARVLELGSGELLPFDILYPMTGGDPATDLMPPTGSPRDASARLSVDRDQSTGVAGIYAAGDVVDSLAQVVVAWSEGAAAATAIHRALPLNHR